MPTTTNPPNLKQNALSGFLVFLIALPLCLGISMASGFPPIAGVMTAIIGGLMSSFLGSSPLTIKGPAAGLIVIAIGAVTELGHGDPVAGYRRTLAVGAVAAVIQIVLAISRAGVIASVMPGSVVHGMLAAIGVIIVAKQTPVLLGVPGKGNPIHMLLSLPNYIIKENPLVAIIGVFSLVLLMVWPRVPRRLRAIPAPMVVLLVAVPLSMYFHFDQVHRYTIAGHYYQLGPDYLVHLPGSIVKAITFPDFSMIWTGTSWKYIAMFALVGSIESLLSVIAVDAMNPSRSSSDLNKDLLSVGIGNLLSAMVGGLPMISEIVRSRANIDSGATSKYSNFFHGFYLFAFVALVPMLLHRIPLAALAAMLVYTGFRLASPKEFAHVYQIGKDQFLLFVTTLITTLATDLLIGVATGLVLKMVLHMIRGASPLALFRTPVTTKREGDQLLITVNGPAVFTNLLSVRRLLTQLDPAIKEVVINFSEATLVDHTFQEKVKLMGDELPNATLKIVGLEQLKAISEHPLATRSHAEART
jgi:MFS superfamily sulfate permease-like transporter